MNEINNTSKSNKSRKSHKSNQSNKTNQTNHQSSDKPNIHPAKQTAAICCHWFLCSAPPPGCVSESPAHLHAETHLKTRTFGPWSHELLSPNPNGTRGQTPSVLDKHAADQQKCWGGPGKWEYQPILVVLQVPRNESLNQQDGRTIQQIVLLFEQQSVGL